MQAISPLSQLNEREDARITSVPDAESAGPTYFMESPTEVERLENKTDPVVVGQQLLTAGLRLGMDAVDLACGSGATTRIMAQIAGPDRVIGIDGNVSRVAYAQRLAEREGVAARFLTGSAEQIPLDPNSADFCHARFLFQYLPNPQAVLQEMIRVTRPGGKVVVVDLDDQLRQLAPMSDALRFTLEEALRLLAPTGFDPQVGRKLFSWFTAAGLRKVTARVETHQLYAGDVPARDRANWREKLATATDYLTKKTGDATRWSFFRDEYYRQLTAPDACYYSTMLIVSGIVEGGSVGA